MNKLIASAGIAIAILNLFLCVQVTYSKVYMISWELDSDYSKWGEGKNIVKGDILQFIYGEGRSVNEVTKENFKKCNSEDPIFRGFDGNTSIPLNKLGRHYFIGEEGHCDLGGMNLTIVVKKSGRFSLY